LNLSKLNKPYLYEFVHVDDFEDTCIELTELDLISRYTKPYIEEEGSSDEDDLENALPPVVRFSPNSHKKKSLASVSVTNLNRLNGRSPI